MEFETQYRIEEDELGSVLWQRRDAVPDEFPRGGGIATPRVEGVISLGIEAYDGNTWYDQWDSDIDGLPWALRVTVMASGHRADESPYDAPTAILRTVVGRAHDLDGEAVGDRFETSVDLSADGKRLAVGAYGNDGIAEDCDNYDETTDGCNAGHVRVFAAEP